MFELIESKYNAWRYALVIIAFTYFVIETDEMRIKIKQNDQRQEALIAGELQEISSVFYNTKETLSKYDFPITDKTKVYFTDSLRKDFLELHTHTETLSYLTAEYGDFNVRFQEYSLKTEGIIKGLRGYAYTEGEIDTAIQAFTIAWKDLHKLTNDVEFSIDNKKDQKRVLEVMNKLSKSLSILDKY